MAKSASSASSVVRVATIAASLGLTSCNPDPYAVSVHKINETAPQSAAAIQLSDPQIYARETILNDRRQEVEFLNRMLDKSEGETFEPQLKRILQYTSSFRGKASASVDPALRTQLQREDEAKRLDADIAVKQREIMLTRLQQQQNQAIKDLNTTPDANTTTQLPPINQTEVNNYKDENERLKKELAEKQKAPPASTTHSTITLPATDTPRSADISATPQERLRDLIAYRGEIRFGQARELLDDSHDHSGNALYRLQFTATVAPGEHKDKYGVARLTILPPRLQVSDYANLYRLWLSHVSYRLNGFAFRSTDRARPHVDTAYSTLAVQRELFRYVTYDLDTGQALPPDSEARDKSTSQVLRLVVPPHLYSSARTITDRADSAEVLKLLKELVGETAMVQTAFRNYQPPAASAAPAAERPSPAPSPQLPTHSDVPAAAPVTPVQTGAINAASPPPAPVVAAPPTGNVTIRVNANPAPQAPDSKPHPLRYSSEIDVTHQDYLKDTARYLVIIGAAKRAGKPTVRCIETQKAIEVRQLFDVPVSQNSDANNKRRYYRAVFELIDPGPSGAELSSVLAASLRGMGDWSFLESERPRVESLLNRILEIQYWADQLRRTANWSNTGMEMTTPQGAGATEAMIEAIRKAEIISDSQGDCHDEQFRKTIPAIFQEQIGQAHFESGQGAFAYAATPQELAQRVSTVASAINSLELGLNVAAQLQGANLGADLSYLRSARGQVDALERLPIVVGFSDRSASGQTVRLNNQGRKKITGVEEEVAFARRLRHQEKNKAQGTSSAYFEADRPEEVCFPYSAFLRPEARIIATKGKQDKAFTLDDSDIVECGWTPQKAQFGWIFGPQAALDPQKKAINLEQAMRSYPVVADVSVPGWWPHATFLYETAWIGNWHNGKLLATDDAAFVSRRFFHRPLPRNRADLDGLTEALAYRSLGGSLATTRIARVEPTDLLYCGDEITLLAYGANVWRGTEAFLNGSKNSGLRVLPDMNGLAITFRTAGLQRAGSVDGGKPKDRLEIATRNGTASYPINVNKDPNCASGRTPATPNLSLAKPRLFGTDTLVRVITSPPLEAFHSVNLEVRPEPVAGAAALAWKPVAVKSSKYDADGRTLLLTLDKALSDIGYTNGTALDMRMQVMMRQDAVGLPLPITTRPVYYADEAGGSITVKTASGDTKLDPASEQVLLVLPPQGRRAYPDLQALKSEHIKGSVAGTPPILFRAGVMSQSTKQEPSFSLVLQSGMKSEDLQKAERAIKLEFEGELELPKLSCAPSCLTLQQKQ